MTTNQQTLRKQLITQAISHVLTTEDDVNLADYFTPDAIIQINEKVLSGIDAIGSRLAWMRQHLVKKTVVIKQLILEGNHGFDMHITTATDDMGQQRSIKVIGYFEFKDNKISLYEDVSIELNANDNLAIATSTED